MRLCRYSIIFTFVFLTSCAKIAVINGVPPIYSLERSEHGISKSLSITLKDNPHCATMNISTPCRYSITILELEVENISKSDVVFNPSQISRTVGSITTPYEPPKDITSNKREIWNSSIKIHPGEVVSKLLIFRDKKCPYGSMKLSIDGVDYVYSQKSPYMSGPLEMLLGILWPIGMLNQFILWPIRMLFPCS